MGGKETRPRLSQPGSSLGGESGGGAPSTSDDMVQFVRMVTSLELRNDEQRYTPFINGCSSDYRDLSLQDICERHVEKMGADAEELQVCGQGWGGQGVCGSPELMHCAVALSA